MDTLVFGGGKELPTDGSKKVHHCIHQQAPDSGTCRSYRCKLTASLGLGRTWEALDASGKRGAMKATAAIGLYAAKLSGLKSPVVSEDVGTFHEAPSEAEVNFLANMAEKTCVQHSEIGRSGPAVSGGGSLTDVIKGVVVCAVRLKKSRDDTVGATCAGKIALFTAVTLMMLGIGSEMMTVVATIDSEMYYKHVSTDSKSTLSRVTSDLESIAGSLLCMIVIIGTDVSMYVTEVHTSRMHNIKESSCSVEEVAKSTPDNSESVHQYGEDSKACENTTTVVPKVGPVPLCVGAGNAYVTVYMSGGSHNMLYGSVNVATSLTASEDHGEVAHLKSVCSRETVGAKIDGMDVEKVQVPTVETHVTNECTGTLKGPDPTQEVDTLQTTIRVSVEVNLNHLALAAHNVVCRCKATDITCVKVVENLLVEVQGFMKSLSCIVA